MQLGMIGLGRMGGSKVRRLLHGGHACVAFDSQPANVTRLAQHGATGSSSLNEFIKKLDTPRVVWLMVPAAVVDTTLHELSPRLQPGDTSSMAETHTTLTMLDAPAHLTPVVFITLTSA